MYKYYDPINVRSPRDCISEVVQIFDGEIDNGAYSLAKITWEGEDRIGIRWNVTLREWDQPNKKSGTDFCIGEPNSRGYPTWFILPNDFINTLLSGKGKIVNDLRELLITMENH